MNPWEEYSSLPAQENNTTAAPAAQDTVKESELPWEDYSQGAGVSQAQTAQQALSPEIYSMFNWTGDPIKDVPKQLAIDSILSPIAEISRGYNYGAAGFYDTVGGALNLLRNVSGNLIPTQQLEEFSKRSAEALRSEAESIPETGLHPAVKTAYGLAGGAVPESLPFVIPGAGAIPLVSKMAVTSALKEYQDEQSLGKSAIDLSKGATEGMVATAAMNLGITALTKGGELLSKYGKNTAEAFLKLSTGDEQLARDYVEGKIKFSNLFDKRTNQEIMQSFEKERVALKRKNADALDSVKEEARVRSFDLSQRVSASKESLKSANMNAEAALKEASTDKFNAVKQLSNEAVNAAEGSLKEKAADDFNSVLTQMNARKKALGEEIGSIKRQLELTSPETGVDYKSGFSGVEKALIEDYGFSIKNGKIVPKAGSTATAKQDASRAQTFYEDLIEFRREGTVPVGAIYRINETASQLADEAFNAGKNEIGAMWSKIRSLTDPKSMIVEGEGLIYKSKEARSLLSDLSKANKAFSEHKKNIDDVIALYTKKDPSGNVVPYPEMAFSALKNNDRRLLSSMAKLDASLPEGQKMFSKMKSLYSDFVEIKTAQEASINLQKKMIQRERAALSNKSRDAEIILAREGRKLSNEEAMKARALIKDTKVKLQGQLDKELEGIDAAEKAIIYNKILNSWISPGKFSQLQVGSAAYAVGSQKVNPGLLAAGLSPKTAKLVADQLLKLPKENILTKEQGDVLSKLLKLKK